MILYNFIDALLVVTISLECFRILQSCSYLPQRGYFKIFLTKYCLLLFVLQLILIVRWLFLPFWVDTIVYFVCAVATLIVKRKCPLVVTKRILRMLVVQLVLLLVLRYFALLHFCVVLLPIICLLCYALCLPVDCCLANYYLNKASKKLSQSNIKVIAITGSYGKTSTKDMLTALLDNAISPKGSCNTPLGIAKFVNNADFANAKYLILEFGARKRGDIARLCKLFPPSCGILTGLCEQHLSTFKTFGGVVKTKGELMENLPSDGFCILNSKDKNLPMLAGLGKCKKIFTDTNVAKTVKKTLCGTKVELEHQGNTFQFFLPHLSNYAVDIFLLCYYLCMQLGCNVGSLLKNVYKVRQTPHRMQISHNGRFWIVDDGYNGNLVGIQNCCQTMQNFNNYKIVIAQGVVECGKQYQSQNVLCGQLLSQSFDVVIAVGKYSKYICQGAKDFGATVVQCKTLSKGVLALEPYLAKDCIVVFQNDIPDVVNI